MFTFTAKFYGAETLSVLQNKLTIKVNFFTKCDIV